ncbi:MAG: circadian clock KaiB family protein [Nitrospira sp.]|nr:circadian clock KaiB family protein [Nitrospira sp.]
MPKKPLNGAAEYEKALKKADAQAYVLRLCISGMTPRSRAALVNLKRICETYLQDRYQLEVIDLYQQPELAAKHQVLATPTLVKTLPPPLRRFLGDLSDTAGTLRRLGVSVTTGKT